MKSKIFLIILIVLFSSLIVCINNDTILAEDTQTKNVDVVIVIDNSGSMSGQPWYDAVEAASNFTDKLKNGDRCAIFCFEDNTNYSYNGEWGSDKPRKLKGFVYTTINGKTELKDNLSMLYPEFSTPLFDTIGAAMDYIVQFKRSKSVGAIVALTDGDDNTNKKFYPSHDYREYKNISLYGEKRYGLLNCSEATFIIGLGIDEYYDSTYKQQLENIAGSSGGSYFTAENSSVLGEIYGDISQEIEDIKMDNLNEINDPYYDGNESNQEANNNRGIPGFTSVFLISTVAFIALFLRKKDLK